MGPDTEYVVENGRRPGRNTAIKRAVVFSNEEELAYRKAWAALPVEEIPDVTIKSAWLTALHFFKKGFRAGLDSLNQAKEAARSGQYSALQITEKSGVVHKYVDAATHTYYIEYNDSGVTVSREDIGTPGKYLVAVFYSPSSVIVTHYRIV